MRIARRALLAAGAAGAFACVSRARAAALPDIGALTAIAEKLIHDGSAAGAALGVARAGQVLVAKGFGFANIETATPAGADTVFRIASCTKQFTAAAILLLAEQGKLAISDPIERFFPGFPRGGAVTVEQLLNHTAGIHDYVLGGLPGDAGNDWRLDPERHRFFARMKPLFDFDPGTKWLYSNSGYVLLGEIIEKASGRPYGEFLKRAMLEPAGMKATALDDAAELVPHRASGYSLWSSKPGQFRNAANAGLPVAEGGLRSTVGDLLCWNRALHGGKLLSPSSLKLMVTAACVKDGRRVGEAHFVPAGRAPGKPPAFVTEPHYGFGLEVCRMFGGRVFWHSGGISGFNALLFRFDDADVDLVLLTNTDNGAVPAFEPMIRAVSVA